MMSSQNRRILVNFKTKKDARKSKESQKENKTEYDPHKSHLKFLTDVTSDILNRGIFSERGLRSAINSQVRSNCWCPAPPLARCFHYSGQED